MVNFFPLCEKGDFSDLWLIYFESGCSMQVAASKCKNNQVGTGTV